MRTVIGLLVAVSLFANGLLAGLLAGHMLAKGDACLCGPSCECRKRIRDDGPYPTGWVMPDPGPVRPSGAAP